MKSFVILVVVLCCAFCLAKEDKRNPAKSKLKRHLNIRYRAGHYPKIRQYHSSVKRTDELTECEIRRAEGENEGRIGDYVPQCEADGSYTPMQCWQSTGECWCVDRYGCEINGTRVPPGNEKPVCKKDESKCEKQRADGGGIGVYVPQCEVDGSYSPTQCSGSTGYCWCVDLNGDKINGTEVGPGGNRPLCRKKTKCEKQRDPDKNQRRTGAYVPQCEVDGSFTPMQYWASTGYSWCVDGNGNEIPGTLTPPGSEGPNCGVETECEKRRQVAENQGLIGAYVPQCEADGSYTPMQCWGSTGYCWCVNKYGCEIPNTEVPPGHKRPKCSD